MRGIQYNNASISRYFIKTSIYRYLHKIYNGEYLISFVTENIWYILWRRIFDIFCDISSNLTSVRLSLWWIVSVMYSNSPYFTLGLYKLFNYTLTTYGRTKQWDVRVWLQSGVFDFIDNFLFLSLNNGKFNQNILRVKKVMV